MIALELSQMKNIQMENLYNKDAITIPTTQRYNRRLVLPVKNNSESTGNGQIWRARQIKTFIDDHLKEM